MEFKEDIFKGWEVMGLLRLSGTHVTLGGRLRDGMLVSEEIFDDVPQEYVALFTQLVSLKHDHVVVYPGFRVLSRRAGKCSIQIFSELCQPLWKVWSEGH